MDNNNNNSPNHWKLANKQNVQKRRPNNRQMAPHRRLKT